MSASRGRRKRDEERGALGWRPVLIMNSLQVLGLPSGNLDVCMLRRYPSGLMKGYFRFKISFSGMRELSG